MEYKDYLKLEENVEHGTYLFPFIIYDTKIPKYYKKVNIHWHEEMEIVIGRKGKCRYTVDFITYEIGEGDILILMPSMLHSLDQLEDNEFIGDTLVFNLSLINNSSIDVCGAKYFNPIINGKINMPIFIKHDQNGYDEILEYINKIVDENYQKRSSYELKIKANILYLFSCLYDFFIKEDSYIESENNYMLNKMKCILAYIKEKYSEEISIDNLAKVSNMSKYYLMRTFKKYIGMTCTNYINEYRLNIASNKLASEDTSIMNISIECGFNNISYFNKLFKEKFKMTPKEYKKKYNQIQ